MSVNAVTRVGDNCTGHGCFPPRPSNTSGAAKTVFVNNIRAVIVGTGYDVHCCDDTCHSSVLADGSDTVFVEGLELGRVTDPVACGSRVAIGSPNVFAGGD